MKINKSTVILKSGKTKASSVAPNKEQLAHLKQQIKEAKLRLQGAKRAVREAKDAMKQAKQALKSAKQAGKPARLSTTGGKAVKKPDLKPAAKKSVGKRRPSAKSSTVIAKQAPSKSATPTHNKPARKPVTARKRPIPVAAQTVATDPGSTAEVADDQQA